MEPKDGTAGTHERKESGPRTIVVAGGTDGMGRQLALDRARRGDQVVAIGNSPAKIEALRAEARRFGARLDVRRADLSSVTATRQLTAELLREHEVIDGLVLFANRPSRTRVVTDDGLERTLALYYVSRYLLGRDLGPALARAGNAVIVNVAGVGVTKGAVSWDDPHLTTGYGAVRAQLQAGRANDLLGVLHADQGWPARYVLYHPGFTRSGDLSAMPAPARVAVRALARVAARTIPAAIAPLHAWLDHPPPAPLTAVDRGRQLPLTLPTLDPTNARRLGTLTARLLTDHG